MKKLFVSMITCAIFLFMVPCSIQAQEQTLIKDEVLAKYLNQVLKLDESNDLTEEQLANITKIELPAGVKDLEGIQYCTNLTWFRNNGKGMQANVDKLGACTKMTEFWYMNTYDLEDISFISNFKDLTYLNLWRNKVSDISALQGLDKLQTIDLCHNQIYDMSPISQYVNSMTSYVHLHDQVITRNITCSCLDDQCVSVENIVKGIHGDILEPENVTGAMYQGQTNTFMLDGDVVTYTFTQNTKESTADLENVYSGQVMLNVAHTPILKAQDIEGKVNKEFTALLPVNHHLPTGGVYSVVDLPEGLMVDENTGVISGTPTKAGKGTYTLLYTVNQQIIESNANYDISEDVVKPVDPTQPDNKPTQSETNKHKVSNQSKQTVKTGYSSSVKIMVALFSSSIIALLVILILKRKAMHH